MSDLEATHGTDKSTVTQSAAESFRPQSAPSEHKGVKRERDDVAASPAGDEAKKPREETDGSTAPAAAGFAAAVANPWLAAAAPSGFGGSGASNRFGSTAGTTASFGAGFGFANGTGSGAGATSTASGSSAAATSAPDTFTSTAASTAPSLFAAPAGTSTGWAASAWAAPAVAGAGFGSSAAPSGSSGGWAVAGWGAPAASQVEPVPPTAPAEEGAATVDKEEEEGEGGDGAVDEEAHNAALLSGEGSGQESCVLGSGSALRRGSREDTGATLLLDAGPTKPLPTGEEHEVTMFQRRGKLFILEKSSESPSEPSSHGVAALVLGTTATAASGSAGSQGPSVGASLLRSGLGAGLGEKVGAPAIPPSAAVASATSGSRWRECGTGPVRLNVRRDLAEDAFPDRTASGHTQASKAKRKDRKGSKQSSPDDSSTSKGEELFGPLSRLIMRQETGAGATHSASGRVLLNTPLHADFLCTMHPQNNRAVQFTAPELVSDDGSSSSVVMRTYLLRLPCPDDAMDMVDRVQEVRQVLWSMQGAEDDKEEEK